MVRKNFVWATIIIAISQYFSSVYGMEKPQSLSDLFTQYVTNVNRVWFEPDEDRAKDKIASLIKTFTSFGLNNINMKDSWDKTPDKSTVLPTIISRSLRIVESNGGVKKSLLESLSYVDILGLLAVMAQDVQAEVITYHSEENTYNRSVSINDQSWRSEFILPLEGEYASVPSIFITLLREADQLKPIADRRENLPGRSDFPGRTSFLFGYKKLFNTLKEVSFPEANFDDANTFWIERIAYIKIFYDIISKAIQDNKIDKNWLQSAYPEIYNEGSISYFEKRKLTCEKILTAFEKKIPNNGTIKDVKEELKEMQPIQEKEERDDPFKKLFLDDSSCFPPLNGLWDLQKKMRALNERFNLEDINSEIHPLVFYELYKETYRKSLEEACKEGKIDKIWLYCQWPMEPHLRDLSYALS